MMLEVTIGKQSKKSEGIAVLQQGNARSAKGLEPGEFKTELPTEGQQNASDQQSQRPDNERAGQRSDRDVFLTCSNSVENDPAIIHHAIFTSDQLKASKLNPILSIEKHPNLGVIIQARMGSSRLPGKVAKIAGSKEYLSHQLDRVLIKCPANKIVVATTDKAEDDVVYKLARKFGVLTFRGSSQDVLKRYIDAAEENKFTDVVRLTGDSPLIDPYVIDEVVNVYIRVKSENKYVSNTLTPSFPLGFNVEITTLKNLQTAWLSSKSEYDHEHVTPYIKAGSIRDCVRVSCSIEKNLSMWRFTLDTVDDDLQLSKILSGVSGFEMDCVVDFAVKNQLMQLNY
jgi:spore coat polysaccharide biosynthesis protein SpsF